MPRISPSLVDQLADLDVFIHTEIPVHEIPYLYVPFREISSFKIEDYVERSLSNSELIALEGERGSGKSCIAYFVFLLNSDTYFPIVVSPVLEDVRDVCTSIENFVRLVLQRVAWSTSTQHTISKTLVDKTKEMLAQKVAFADGKRANITGRIRGLLSILPGVLSAEASIGRDIESYAQRSLEGHAFNTQRVECVRELCETIEAHNKTPVFFIDDTDKFLKRSDEDLSDLVPKFFGQILPALARIDRPIIVAVHTYYNQSDSYKDTARNVIDSRFQIPVLNREALHSLIDRRIHAVSRRHHWRDLFEPPDEAMDSMCSYYSQKQTLRELMRLCKESLRKAQNEGLQSIPSSLVNVVKADLI